MLRLWLCGYVVIYAIHIIECKSGFNDRVCFADSRTCKDHLLSCPEEGNIAVHTAKYGYINRAQYSECQCGRIECAYCSEGSTGQKGVKQCFGKYSDSHYWNIVSKCSFRQSCHVPLPPKRNKTCPRVSKSMLSPSFSRITYGCLNGNRYCETAYAVKCIDPRVLNATIVMKICDSLTELLTRDSSEHKSTVVQFCSANLVAKSISIIYKKRSTGKLNCVCNVRLHDNETDTRVYRFRSLDIRNNSYFGGGSFNITFTSDGKSESIVNKTISQNAVIFEAAGKQKTLIRLSLFNYLSGPESLWIQIAGGHNRPVIVRCQAGEDYETTDSGTTQTTFPIAVSTMSPDRSTNTSGTSAEPDSQSLQTEPMTAQTTRITAESTTSLVHSTSTTNSPDELGSSSLETYEDNVAPIIGGVTGCVAVVAAIVVVVVCYRKRNKSNDGSKERHANPVFNENESTDVLIDDVARKADDQAEPYQVDTENGGSINSNQVISNKGCYDHLSSYAKATPSQPSDDYDVAIHDIDADYYNHLGTDNKPHHRLDAEYDTAVSASKAVRELKNQDHYCYDHLGMSKTTTVVDSDYDTTTRFKK